MNRALGITSAKQKFARATGIPTTKQGRDQKIGRMVSGGSCLFSLIFLVVLSFIFILSVKFAYSAILNYL